MFHSLYLKIKFVSKYLLPFETFRLWNRASLAFWYTKESCEICIYQLLVFQTLVKNSFPVLESVNAVLNPPFEDPLVIYHPVNQVLFFTFSMFVDDHRCFFQVSFISVKLSF